MRRGIALGVPGLAVAAGAGLWVQTRRVADAPLPQFVDGDPSGCYGDPVGTTVRISVLGDSTITGPGLPRADQVWLAQIAERLPWRVELRSHAKGGSRVRDVLRHQVPRAVEDAPDLFVVVVGANDVMHATPGPRFRRDLAELLDRLRCVAPVVTFGIGDLSVVPRLPPSLKPVVALRCSTVDRIHHRVARGRDGVTRVPVSELADPLFRRAGGHIWADDLFHPNHLGHAIWARCFEPSIRAAVDAACRAVDLRDGHACAGVIRPPARTG